MPGFGLAGEAGSTPGRSGPGLAEDVVVVVVLVVSLFSAGALVLLVVATSIRAAGVGRTTDVQGLPLVAGRGARFGDATAVQRSAQRSTVGHGLRLAPPADELRPTPFREPRAA